jgi:hypothetical protein
MPLPRLLLVLLTCLFATSGAFAAKLTYRLSRESDTWPDDKRRAIVKAMDEAVALYNKHGTFDKAVVANYSPGVPTAQANYDGWIDFGGAISTRVALHELCHTLGVGTHPRWRSFLKDGVWTGENATALVRTFDGPEAVLKGDRMHFWPYGLNFDREDGEEQRIRHIQLVEAIHKDLVAAEAAPKP